MDSYAQQQNRMRQRRQQRNVDYQRGATFLGVITASHDRDNERVIAQYHGGERRVRTLHPYVGSDSWIRVGAESGIPILMTQRPDSDEPEFLAYGYRNPEERIGAYNGGAGTYRPLDPGEIELKSTGGAALYLSRRPLLEQRAGLLRHWLDQDALQHGARAPQHVRQLHLNRAGEVGDEERLGVVTRPSDGSRLQQRYVSASRQPSPALAGQFAATAVTSGVVTTPGPFAKEHTVVLNTGAAFPPKLLDVRQGDVIDDAGEVLNLSASGKPLRYKGEWFTESVLGGVFFVGIDQDGNFAVTLPDDATVGGDVKIPAGDLLMTIGKSYATTVQQDYSVGTADGQMTLDSEQDFSVTVRDGSIVLRPSDELNVGGADEPVVLGNVLKDFMGQVLDLLAQHFHTGNTGGPTPLDPGAVVQLNQLKSQFITNDAILSDYVNVSKQP